MNDIEQKAHALVEAAKNSDISATQLAEIYRNVVKRGFSQAVKSKVGEGEIFYPSMSGLDV